MRARQKVSRAGVELIKSFEGLRSTAARLPDGRWTLGYGHTFSAREGARVTQEDADALLRFDLLPIVDALNNVVLVPLNQNQFDALVSFCFNIGVENFAQSTVLKRINEGRMTEAALAMDAWRSAEFNGQTYVLAPLIRRRAAEKNLFLTPDETSGNAPTLLVRPVEDAGGTPVHQPSELNSPDRGGILSTFPVGVQQTTEPSTTPASALPPEMLSPYARPAPATFGHTPVAPQPVAQPVERIVEALPEGLVAASAMRETPVVEDAPLAPFAGEETEPQMSPAVAAAIARAQEEQRLRDEAQQEIQRQAAALAAARAAEEARILEQQRLEAARQEQERQEAERAAVAAEVARLEQTRLEQARFEQENLVAAEAARLEQLRLEEERQERDRMIAAETLRREQERLEFERGAAAAAEAARLEQERLERERLASEAARVEQERFEREAREREAREREAREREAREREAREQAEREKAAAAAPVPPSDQEAEKIRKAEAAAALMRLYSPYGGGALGRPLAAPAPAPRPATAPAPVVAPQPAPAPVAEEFTNHSLIAPQQASSAPIELSSRREPAPEPEEIEEESEIQGFAPFKPVVSPSAMPAPVITALNPYARPITKPEPVQAEPVKATPEVVEVPRPRAADLSAAPAPEAFKPELARPVQSAHWREQLQRPLPDGYRGPEVVQPETQGSLLSANPAFDDDSGAWTMDGDRIALSAEDMHEETATFGKMLMRTMKWIFISVLGLGCLGVGAAAWFKYQDPTVVRAGMAGDFRNLSIIAAALGIFFVSVSVWLIMKRLGGLKD